MALSSSTKGEEPAVIMSQKYWPAPRSVLRRAVFDGPDAPRYSTVMPYFFWKASVKARRGASPWKELMIATFPSRLAAWTSWAHSLSAAGLAAPVRLGAGGAFSSPAQA